MEDLENLSKTMCYVFLLIKKGKKLTGHLLWVIHSTRCVSHRMGFDLEHTLMCVTSLHYRGSERGNTPLMATLPSHRRPGVPLLTYHISRPSFLAFCHSWSFCAPTVPYDKTPFFKNVKRFKAFRIFQEFWSFNACSMEML